VALTSESVIILSGFYSENLPTKRDHDIPDPERPLGTTPLRFGL
jgi:hypothetical protein